MAQTKIIFFKNVSLYGLVSGSRWVLHLKYSRGPIIGWSLFLKIDLNLMDIKSCVLFTELGRIVVESMVFYIGKSTPRSTHFGGKTMACEVFF